jgi:hypothetical protein
LDRSKALRQETTKEKPARQSGTLGNAAEHDDLAAANFVYASSTSTEAAPAAISAASSCSIAAQTPSKLG